MRTGFDRETREKVYRAYYGFCCVKGCTEPAIDFHHALPNTKINEKKFPLLLQSPINCKPVCRKHHRNHGKHPELKFNEKIAKVIEEFLRNLKKHT